MDNNEKAKKAYYEACEGVNVKENEQIVLECKTVLSYCFAKNIPGADIKAHEQVILELKDRYYSYVFARDIKGADIKAHELVILELKDPYYSYVFTRDIPGANVEEHYKVVLNSGNQEYIEKFNKFIKEKNISFMSNLDKANNAYVKARDNINVKENEQVVLESKTIWSYHFAKNISGANLKAHEQVILELNQPNWCFYFAADIPGANIEEHYKVVLNYGNQEYIEKFNKFIKEKNIVFMNNNNNKARKAYFEAFHSFNVKENEKIVLECKIGYWCCLFARDIHGADIKSHEQVILELKNPEYSYDFARYVPSANIEEHYKVVLNSGNQEYIYKFNKFIKEKNIVFMNNNDKVHNAYIEARQVKNINVPDAYNGIIKIIPEDCIIFGGFVRDAIKSQCDNKKDFKYKDIDLLFSDEDKIQNFIEVLKNSNEIKSFVVQKKACYTSNIAIDGNIHLYRIYFSIKEEDTYSNVQIDCVFALDKNKSIFSDFDINSLFGYVKDGKINVVSSFAEGIDVYDVIKNISNKEANPIFSEETPDQTKQYRKNKISVDWKVNEVNKKFNLKNSKQIFEEIKRAISVSNSKDLNNPCYANISKIVENNCDKKSVNFCKKEEKKMNSTIDFFKSNLVEGVYQGAAHSAVENLGKSLIAAMEQTGVDEVSINLAKQFVEHPMGKATLSLMLGAGIHFIPVEMIQGNKHLQKVAEKCIQNASSEGTQVALNAALNFVLPAMLNAVNNNKQLAMLDSIAPDTKVRVETKDDKTDHLTTEDVIPNLSLVGSSKVR